jgi:DNA invertase Pin-like site-specific DNA recombinase
VTDYGFIRVSTGSQDAQTQERDIRKAFPDALIIRTDTKAASASKGEQMDAINELVAKLRKGDRVVVTDSSRLDRNPDVWAQMAVLVSVKAKGAEVVDLSNPGFGGSDKMGVILTGLKQMENAEKSHTVKVQTYRGISQIRDNKAHHGPLPQMWESYGIRYAKQARCTNPDAVIDIYTRVADGESLLSVARSYGLYPQSIKKLIRLEANHTGVINCSYTHEGVTETWGHEVTPVVESSLWWRANKVLATNADKDADNRANKGGRPVAQPGNWLSGVLDCPCCGGKLFVNAGRTPAGNPRTPKLRCGGHPRERKACGRYKGTNALPVLEALGEMFGSDDTDILSFQRVSGNAHELDELKASLARLQGRLSVTEDDDELDALIIERKALKSRIEAFEVIPDSFDYAPTGRTVSQMWNEGDDAVKRGMVRAVKDAGGLDFTATSIRMVVPAQLGTSDVIDLGNGLCFRRQARRPMWDLDAITEEA